MSLSFDSDCTVGAYSWHQLQSLRFFDVSSTLSEKQVFWVLALLCLLFRDYERN